MHHGIMTSYKVGEKSKEYRIDNQIEYINPAAICIPEE